MMLLPEGTLRRRIFEWCDRTLGNIFFCNGKTISTNCGDQLKAGTPCLFCKWSNPIVSTVIEQDHYLKNAGKP